MSLGITTGPGRSIVSRPLRYQPALGLWMVVYQPFSLVQYHPTVHIRLRMNLGPQTDRHKLNVALIRWMVLDGVWEVRAPMTGTSHSTE